MAKKQEEAIPASDNVEQIREILFGGHIKDYEQRFKALEDTLEHALAKISDSFNQRLDTLNDQLKELHTQLQREATVRQDGDESLDGLLQNQRAEVSQQIDHVESQAHQQVAAVSEALTAMGSTMGEQISANREVIKQGLTELDGRLSEQNISRKELARLLGGLAIQLDPQPENPKRK